MIPISEILVFVFDLGSWLWQSAVTDIVHLFSQFTRGWQRPIALLDTIARIIIVAVSTAFAGSSTTFLAISARTTGFPTRRVIVVSRTWPAVGPG
jgi:hypothetical protein